MNPTNWNLGRCFLHSVAITLISLLVVFLMNLRLFKKSILQVVFRSVSISYIGVGIDLFILSLLHSLSETIYTRVIQADITVTELSPKRNTSLNVPDLLDKLSSSFTNNYYIRNENDGICDLERDSLLYIEKEILSLHLR